MHKLFVALLTGLCLSAMPTYAQDRTVRLASFQWPPYASEQISQQGTVTDTLRRAFAAVGYTLVVEFQPGRRANAMTAAGNAVAGYFPEYFTPELDRRWLLSEPIGGSPLGLAQRVDNPVPWAVPEHLKPYSIGILEDDVVGGAFGRRISQGDQKVEPAADDTGNLMRLASGRVDLAMIDSLTFAYLMANDPRLSSSRGLLAMNPRLIEQRSLHVAFRKTREGRQFAKLLAEGLRRTGYTPPSFGSE